MSRISRKPSSTLSLHRQRERRRLLLALGLGILFCLIIGALLYILNVQHRI